MFPKPPVALAPSTVALAKITSSVDLLVIVTYVRLPERDILHVTQGTVERVGLSELLGSVTCVSVPLIFHVVTLLFVSLREKITPLLAASKNFNSVFVWLFELTKRRSKISVKSSPAAAFPERIVPVTVAPLLLRELWSTDR